MNGGPQQRDGIMSRRDGITYINATSSTTVHDDKDNGESDADLLSNTQIRALSNALQENIVPPPVDSSGSTGTDDSCASSKTIHLKGFAKNITINFTSTHDPKRNFIIQEIIRTIQEWDISTICWDGDNYQVDSFTSLLPILKNEIPTLRFIAFLSSSDVDFRQDGNERGFHETWKNHSLVAHSTTVFLVDDDIHHDGRYDRLGCLGMKCTRSKLVIAVGGGNTVHNEYQYMVKDGVCFILFDVTQISASKELVRSNLGGLPSVQTISIQDY